MKYQSEDTESEKIKSFSSEPWVVVYVWFPLREMDKDWPQGFICRNDK